MSQLVLVYVYGGWLVPTLLLIGGAIMSCLASFFMVSTMSRLPGNRRFERRVEFANLAKALFPRWLFWLAFSILVISFQLANVLSIIQSAQRYILFCDVSFRTVIPSQVLTSY